MNFMSLSDILYIFPTIYYTELRDHIIGIFVVNQHHVDIFSPRFVLVENVQVNIE